MSDKNKHVTPPAIFMLEEKIHEQQKEIDELKESLRLAHEALDSIASRHVKIKSIESWDFEDAKKVIITDTKIARQALKDLEERHEFLSESIYVKN